MAVEFNTREYEFSHGRKPRGRGAWAFAFRRDPDMSEIIWVNGAYAEAKKIAREKAKAASQPVVYVCS